MKKIGFTLVEILITLAILGIVAALTIPNLATDINEQANAAKLSATITELENGFASIMNEEEQDNLANTTFGAAIASDNLGDFKSSLARYFKIQDYSTSIGYTWTNIQTISSTYNFLCPYSYAAGDSSGEMETKSDTPVNPDDPTPDPGDGTGGGNAGSIDCSLFATLKSGAVFGVAKGSDPTTLSTTYWGTGVNTLTRVANILIDVNGPERPNRYGRDVFAFSLGGDGILYPFGGLTAIVFTQSSAQSNNTPVYNSTSEANFQCSVSAAGVITGNGLGCTARLIENGFKFDY